MYQKYNTYRKRKVDLSGFLESLSLGMSLGLAFRASQIYQIQLACLNSRLVRSYLLLCYLQVILTSSDVSMYMVNIE